MPGRARLPGLWGHGDFLKFWAGQTVSFFGSEFTALALPLVAILTLHTTAAQVGFLTAAGTLPWLLFGLFVGVGIDRLRRRPILIATDLGRAVLLASVPIAALVGVLSIWQLYIVAFLVGTLTVCFDTTYQSYLPALVEREHLIEANGKMGISFSLAGITAPGLAGAVIQALTAPLAIAADAASFLVSALSIGLIHKRESIPHLGEDQSVWAAIHEGIAFIRRQPLLRAIAGANATFVLFLGMTQAVLLVFFTRSLHLSPGIIGIIFGTGDVGGLIGTLTAGRLARWLRLGPTIIGASFFRGAAFLLVPLVGVLPAWAMPLLIASQVLHNLGAGVYTVTNWSVRQSLAPDRLRGRVAGSFFFLVRGTTPIGAFAGGVLAGRVGVVSTLVVAAGGLLLPAVWLLVSPLPRLRSQPADADEIAAST